MGQGTHRHRVKLVPFILLGVTLLPFVLQVEGASSYAKHHKHNASSSAVFEPRGDMTSGGYSSSSFGTSGGGYGAPSVGGGGGGGYDSYAAAGSGGGGSSYGAPAATAYKYQIYPSMMGGGGWGGGGGGGGMAMGGWGWGGGGDEDEGLDKELLGLLGLKGLKGLLGLLPLLKGLLLIKKLGLFPIFLPLLLPLLLLKAALLLLPLLLLLLIPIPVITTGRKLLESAGTGQGAKLFQETLDGFMSKLPEDLSHIIEKIKTKATTMFNNFEGSDKLSLSSSKDVKESSSRSSGHQQHQTTGSVVKSKPVKFVKPQQTSVKSKSASLP